MTKKKDFKTIWKEKGQPALIHTGVGAAAAYTGSLLGSHHRVPPWLSAIAGLGIMAAGHWSGKPWLTAGGAAMFTAIRNSEMQTSTEQVQMRTNADGKINFKDELHNTKEHAKAHLSAFSTKFLLHKLLRPKDSPAADAGPADDSPGSDLGAVAAGTGGILDSLNSQMFQDYDIANDPRTYGELNPQSFYPMAMPEAETMDYPGIDFDRV